MWYAMRYVRCVNVRCSVFRFRFSHGAKRRGGVTGRAGASRELLSCQRASTIALAR